MTAALKLTVYFGERDRAGRALTADVLGELFARQRIRVAVLQRGIEGFGLKHRLQSHRMLTLSEDLPLVWVAVDAPERIAATLAEVDRLVPEGLVTLERARTGSLGRAPEPEADGAVKLTLYPGRGERSGGRLAHLAAVDVMHERGLTGATVLLGVDGVREGRRVRARLRGGNRDVPAMVIAVGEPGSVAGVLPPLAEVLPGTFLTLERVRALKRDGRRLAALPSVPGEDVTGLGLWQKVTVFAADDASAGDDPLYVAFVRRLRAAGAAGATVLGGVWGFSGDAPPHGDRLFGLRRRVPIVAVAIDRPHRMAALWPVIDEVTARAGLVTAEVVPAFRAGAPAGDRVGGLRLADPGAR